MSDKARNLDNVLLYFRAAHLVNLQKINYFDQLIVLDFFFKQKWQTIDFSGFSFSRVGLQLFFVIYDKKKIHFRFWAVVQTKQAN